MREKNAKSTVEITTQENMIDKQVALRLEAKNMAGTN